MPEQTDALVALGPASRQLHKQVRGGSAFAGVHPRKQHLLLKTEQVSKNRWHLDLKLTAPGEIDAELLGWPREAYDLGR